MHHGERVRRSTHAEPRGPQMISVVDYESAEEDVWEELEVQADIMQSNL